MIEMHALASAYAGKIYVVWNQMQYFDKYELYRNGILIGEQDSFEKPTIFDHDHHTNLFKKDSNHQLMYTDSEVKPFTVYQYQVKGYRGEKVFESDIAYITLS